MDFDGDFFSSNAIGLTPVFFFVHPAGDNNGNCATPYDKNCVDADPADNTDLCLVDHRRTKSPGIHTGYAQFPGDNNDGEGSAHCHGFAWAQDALDPTSIFKGNNLFYVSMYDHLSKRGYVTNVPGAPMCGCLEQMPIVTRSDCTQIDVGKMKVDFEVKRGNLHTHVKEVNLNFNSCQGVKANNNLEEHYKRLVKLGKATNEELNQVQETLVGKNNCDLAIEDFEEAIAKKGAGTASA